MKHFLLLVLTGVMLCTASCATSKRLSRVNSEHVLQRHNAVDGNAINLWPFFIASKDYRSVFYPFIDWDKQGFSVRPIVNKEGDEWSFLFPLFATNPQNGDGWCGIVYWNKPGKYYGTFPLFHYSANKNDLKYIGPIWWETGYRGNTNFGFFPLLWSFDRAGMFFPLCFFDEREFYSWIFSMEITDHDFYQRHYNRTRLPDDTYSMTIKAGKSLWYYALLWYGGYNHFRTLPPDHPDQILHNWLIEKNLYFKETGKKDFHSNPFYRFFQNRFDKSATTVKESWFGLFPFFHYNSFRDSYKFNLLFGLGAKAVRTPAKDQNSIFLWLFNREHERKRGKFAVDPADTFRHVVGFLWHDQTKTYWQMTPEAAFRFQGIDPDQLSLRSYLAIPEDIKEWEKGFGKQQAELMRNSKSTSIWKHFYSRPLYRTAVLPTPKTAAEAEALLKDLKDPKHYVPVTEKKRILFPFFRQTSIQEGDRLNTDTGLLMNLLFRSRTAPYEHFFHILGPFGYLRKMEFAEGDYEREKFRTDFQMSLLAYKEEHDRYERKKSATDQFRGIDEDELRRRMILTDPKAIKDWEKNVENWIRILTPFSTVKVPKTAAEAQALLDEMNKTEHFQLKKKRAFGVAPFFHRMTDSDETQTDLLLGALASFRYSPTRELTHILGPLGYYHRIDRSAADAKYGQQFKKENTCIFFVYNNDEQSRIRTAASGKESERVLPYLLTRRLRLTDAGEIAAWEREYTVTAWMKDPVNPAPTPKSVAAAKAALERLEAPDQFRDQKQNSKGMYPFLDVTRGTDQNSTSVLLGTVYKQKETKDETGTSDHFSILGKLGYFAEDSKTEGVAGKQNTTRKRYAFLTGRKVETFWKPTPETQKNWRTFDSESLRERLLLTNPKDIRKWENEQVVRLWEQDPAAESYPAIPKTGDEVRALYQKNKQAERYQPVTSTRTDVLTPVIFTAGSDTEGNRDFTLLSLLSGYEKEKQDESFHILGPFGFLTETWHLNGQFQHEKRKKTYCWGGLLFYSFRNDHFIPTLAHKQKFTEYLSSTYYMRRLIVPQTKKSEKDDVVRTLKKQFTLADGTLSCAVPENAADAMKFYREYHADHYYEPDTEYGFGIAPLIHYSGTESGRKSKLILPPLLSWYWKNNTASSTKILCGLLYSAGSEKKYDDPMNVRFLSDLPDANLILSGWDEEKFLNGDLDITGYQDESRRILLVAARHYGKVLYWKNKTPEEVKNLYNLLDRKYLFEEPKRHEGYWEKIRKCMKKLKLPESHLATWKSRQLLRKQLFDQHVESCNFYERGNFGKLLYRYASSRNRTVFWLGGGLLAKYEKQSSGEENTSVLGWLYRSRVTPTEQTRLYFPFVKTHKDPQKESFSFLWRVVNVETDQKTGEKSGHIFFIPF